MSAKKHNKTVNVRVRLDNFKRCFAVKLPITLALRPQIDREMNIEIVEASIDDVKEVSDLVQALLLELEPESKDEIEEMALCGIATELFESKKIYAFLAKKDKEPIGVITLHECAAIYAGGLFGEISEMYVKPEYRSLAIGKLLIQESIAKASELNWQRIEVCSPPEDNHQDTVRFYKNNNFKATGTRLRLLVSGSLNKRLQSDLRPLSPFLHKPAKKAPLASGS